MSVESTLAERGKRYGEFIYHAAVSQELKAVINCALESRQKELADDQMEALEMICHKIARIINGDAYYVDNWHDIAGYATLVEQRLLRDHPET